MIVEMRIFVEVWTSARCYADVIIYKNRQKDQIIEAENAEEEQTPCMSATDENALKEENLLKDTTVNAEKDTEQNNGTK